MAAARNGPLEPPATIGIVAAEAHAQPAAAHVGVGEPVRDDRAAAADPLAVAVVALPFQGPWATGAPSISSAQPREA